MGVAARALVGAVRVYQATVSRAMPARCRFEPSCSEYMAVAITRFGAGGGVWLGLRRLGRCHPFHPGGIDPVPRAR